MADFSREDGQAFEIFRRSCSGLLPKPCPGGGLPIDENPDPELGIRYLGLPDEWEHGRGGIEIDDRGLYRNDYQVGGQDGAACDIVAGIGSRPSWSAARG